MRNPTLMKSMMLNFLGCLKMGTKSTSWTASRSTEQLVWPTPPVSTQTTIPSSSSTPILKVSSYLSKKKMMTRPRTQMKALTNSKRILRASICLMRAAWRPLMGWEPYVLSWLYFTSQITIKKTSSLGIDGKKLKWCPQIKITGLWSRRYGDTWTFCSSTRPFYKAIKYWITSRGLISKNRMKRNIRARTDRTKSNN